MNEFRITASPWPFKPESLELTVSGRQISAQRFTSDAEFQRELQQAAVVSLQWQLFAGE